MRDFEQELASFEPILGFNPALVEQGSEEWHNMKLGVISASKAKCFLAGKKTDTRATYMDELVAEVCTREWEQVSAKSLEWGNTYEPEARLEYIREKPGFIKSLSSIYEIPFIYKDKYMRFGCSPDGLCSADDVVTNGLELKCPKTSKVFVASTCRKKIKPEYMQQCQFSMWVTGLDIWDFAVFDPRMKGKKLHYVTLEKDPKMIDKFEETAVDFLADMKEMLLKMGRAFGDQWKQGNNNEQ